MRNDISVSFAYSIATERSEVNHFSCAYEAGSADDNGFSEVFRCDGLSLLCQFPWRAGKHDFSAGCAAVGTHIDEPVRLFHYVKIVFDDNDGIAPVHQAVQQRHDLLHIGSVQTGGGLVQHIDVALFVQVFGQLHPLAFAAGEGGQGLPQAIAYAVDSEMLAMGAFDGDAVSVKTYGNTKYADYGEQWNEEEYYEYNLEKAKELLAASGASKVTRTP